MIRNLWFALNGILYLLLGLAFFFGFETISDNIGFKVDSGSAAIELVTVFGGLELALGLLFIYALFDRRLTSFAIQMLIFTYTAFTLGRLIGISQYEVTDTLTYYLLGVELSGSVISWVLFLKGSER
jgi:hypothetical protein